MNVNFGLFPTVPEIRGKDGGRQRKLLYIQRAKKDLGAWLKAPSFLIQAEVESILTLLKKERIKKGLAAHLDTSRRNGA
jgi:hypothetical protein